MTFIVPIISLAYLFSGFRAFFMPMIAGTNKTDIIGKWTLYGIIIFYYTELFINSSAWNNWCSYIQR